MKLDTEEIDDAAASLVIARLSAMAPNVRLSVGGHGTFTRSQLITEVKNNSDVGKTIVKLQLNYLRHMPSLSQSLV
ncbi:MAG: hypothetical protein WC408_04015 [Candidatus Micrarchaeia archaeon]|jgi:hypothetical protein